MDTKKIIQPKVAYFVKVWPRVRMNLNMVLRGMASSVDVCVVHDYSYPHQSTKAALRRDWEQVRDYFHHAIEQMTAQEKLRNAEDEKLNNEQAARPYHKASGSSCSV